MIRPAVICARGGSKGIPGKNVREFAGKPLICWTIEQALRVACIDTVIVSSDSDEILDIARNAGAQWTVKRPQQLASDTSSVHPAIQHALQAFQEETNADFESFVLLQTTSPLRADVDIEGAVSIWEQYQPGSVVSASPARHSPYYTILEKQGDGTLILSKQSDKPVARRQDSPECWTMNGAVYVFNKHQYFELSQTLYPDSRLYSMPEERSIDIDLELDWEIAECLAEKRLVSSEPSDLVCKKT